VPGTPAPVKRPSDRLGADLELSQTLSEEGGCGNCTSLCTSNLDKHGKHGTHGTHRADRVNPPASVSYRIDNELAVGLHLSHNPEVGGSNPPPLLRYTFRDRYLRLSYFIWADWRATKMQLNLTESPRMGQAIVVGVPYEVLPWHRFFKGRRAEPGGSSTTSMVARSTIRSHERCTGREASQTAD